MYKLNIIKFYVGFADVFLSGFCGIICIFKLAEAVDLWNQRLGF